MSKEKRLCYFARKLRKNMTDAERKLWFRIRNNQLGVKFRRQQPIGNYIADFICFEKKLVIEIDGGEHLENKRDEARDKWFRKQRFQILRFWNNEVFTNLEGVLKIIKEKLSPSPLILSHQGRGKRKQCHEYD